MPRPSDNSVYNMLSKGDEEELMLPERPFKPAAQYRSIQLIKAYVCTACNLLLFLISLSLIFVAHERTERCPSIAQECTTRNFTVYSPLFEHLNLAMRPVTINASVASVMKSPFIGRPSAEIDAAWEAVGSRDPVAVSADEVRAMGKDVKFAARWPETFGFGPDTFVAAPNAMHHIHCLDQIRRDLDFDHYYRKKFPDGQRSELHRFHTDHCLFIVLQQLMCRPSTEMFMFEWVEGNLAPFPDFNVEEKCMDFDTILHWHRNNKIPRRHMLDLRIQDGQAAVPMPDNIKNVLDITGGEHSS